MKRIIAFVSFCLLLMIAMPNLLQAQTNLPAIVKGIKAGDANLLQAHFAEEVNLRLPEANTKVLHIEATQQLQRFFKEHKPTHFEVKHEGTAPDGKSKFVVGDLKTTNASYRLNMLLRGNSIVELSIK